MHSFYTDWRKLDGKDWKKLDGRMDTRKITIMMYTGGATTVEDE
jgi:hypothetical protein